MKPNIAKFRAKVKIEILKIKKFALCDIIVFISLDNIILIFFLIY